VNVFTAWMRDAPPMACATWRIKSCSGGALREQAASIAIIAIKSARSLMAKHFDTFSASMDCGHEESGRVFAGLFCSRMPCAGGARHGARADASEDHHQLRQPHGNHLAVLHR